MLGCPKPRLKLPKYFKTWKTIKRGIKESNYKKLDGRKDENWKKNLK